MPPVLKRAGLILIICAGLFVAGCGDDDSADTSSPTAASTAAESTTSEDVAKREKPKVVPPKGPKPKKLVEKTLIPGTGPEAKVGDEVAVNYVGVGYVSGTEFDSSWSRNEPLSFTLGEGNVIEGWEQGVEGMKVGERRELIIPPNLAYGNQRSGPIAANATLVFVIDLVSVS